MEQEKAFDFLKRLADGISLMFGNQCEVVIHDMKQAESPVIYIKNQHVTEREIGEGLNVFTATDTDLLLNGRDIINCEGIAKNKTTIKSSVFHLKDDNYHYAIGINLNYSNLFMAQSILKDLVQLGDSHNLTAEPDNSVSHMLEDLYKEAIEYIGKPVHIMKKNDRVKMVCYLYERGAFSIHKGIPIISEKMNISRYTIYNYLKEIKSKPSLLT